MILVEECNPKSLEVKVLMTVGMGAVSKCRVVVVIFRGSSTLALVIMISDFAGRSLN